MFSGLKERLQAARNRLSGSIGAVAEAAPPAPADPAAPSTPATPQKGPTLADKVKILIIDRELVVSEKDVAEALDELEMTLLESDVALPVADAIIADIRTGLVGKHRKIGESVDALVVRALRTALLNVLGKGFDLPAYIIKLLFCLGIRQIISNLHPSHFALIILSCPDVELIITLLVENLVQLILVVSGVSHDITQPFFVFHRISTNYRFITNRCSY